MNLTSEQIERLRPGFETWFLSACQFDDPKILDRNGAGYMWSGTIWAFRGYLALASAMVGEESVERAARATCFPNASDEVWRLVKGDGKQVAIGIARATLLAALGLGE